MYLLQNHNNTEEVKREEVDPGSLVCHSYITLSNDWARVKEKYHILEVSCKLFPHPSDTKSWLVAWKLKQGMTGGVPQGRGEGGGGAVRE